MDNKDKIMKEWRERFMQLEKEREKEELESIIDKPDLTPNEIWNISERNFLIWRRKHDYPRLLNHFHKKLKGFDDWKKEYNINNEFLISFGLVNCLKPNFGRAKYVIQKKWKNEVTKFISFQNLNKKTYRIGPYPVEHKLITTFLGYIDWANKKKIKIWENRKNENILHANIKSNIDSPEVEAMIMNDIPLLKVGGVKVIPSHFGLIKPKYFDLVNADYLILEGEMATQGHKLIFDYSSVDDLTCKNLELPLVDVHNSTMSKLRILDSTIRQWNFSHSTIRGRIINSELSTININGGIFNLDFKDTTISSVTARHYKKSDFSFIKTYQTLKQLYANQGNDKKAIEYFLLEKKIERARLKKEVLKPDIGTFFKTSWIVNLWIHTKHRLVYFVKLFGSWVNHLFWGYGRQPLRILPNSLLIILSFAIIFFINRTHLSIVSHDFTLYDALYYSTVTFTTLGTNEINPNGILKIYVIIEAVLGVLCLGFLIGGLSKSKY